MSGGFASRFHGVRGSTPCAGPTVRALRRALVVRVAVEADGQPPIIFDLGTGLRPYGDSARCDGEFHGTRAALAPALGPRAGPAVLRAVAQPGVDARHLRAAPGRGAARRGVRADDAPAVLPDPARPASSGDVRFHDTGDDDFPVGLAKVRSRWVRHVGPTLGFRVEWNGVSVAYLPDHGPGCCPDDPDDYVPHDMLELCDGVDLLIHDAQHTPRGVRAEAALGSLHRRLRGARRARVRRRTARAVPPRPGARRRRARSHRVAHGRSLGARSAVPRSVAAYEGLAIDLASPADEPAQLHTLNPDAATYRTVLGHFATGVVARDRDGRRREPVGMACNSFTSVSLDPPLVLFCAAKSSTTWPRIQAARQVGGEHPRRGRRRGLPPVRAEGRRPVRAHRRSGPGRAARRSSTTRSRSSTARPIAEHDAGDHVIVVGRVLELGYQSEGKPLLFYRGGYGRYES